MDLAPYSGRDQYRSKAKLMGSSIYAVRSSFSWMVSPPRDYQMVIKRQVLNTYNMWEGRS
jgi:hypothetical protein